VRTSARWTRSWQRSSARDPRRSSARATWSAAPSPPRQSSGGSRSKRALHPRQRRPPHGRGVRRGPTFDPAQPDPGRQASAWDAERITRARLDFLASFEETIVVPVAGLGDVLVCHATPRSYEAIVTSLTPDADLRAILADVEQGLVVCGHTHRRYDRTVDSRRMINAGTVGCPTRRRAARSG
jgi:hypothetical protein